MGQTGSELVGIMILVLVVFGVIGLVGFKIIDRIEAGRNRRKSVEGEDSPATNPAGSQENNLASSNGSATLESKVQGTQSGYLVWVLYGLPILCICVLLLAFITRSQPAVYPPGQTGSTSNWSLKVINYQLPGKLFDTTKPLNQLKPAQSQFQTRPGTTLAAGVPDKTLVATGEWLVVQIELSNLKGQPQEIAPYQLFQLLDSQNTGYALNDNPAIKAYLSGNLTSFDPRTSTFTTPLLANTDRPSGSPLATANSGAKFNLPANLTVRFPLVFDVDPTASGFELLVKQNPQLLFVVTQGQSR